MIVIICFAYYNFGSYRQILINFILLNFPNLFLCSGVF